MSAGPKWLTEAQVRMLHAEALRLFGGLAGVRDVGLLQSALARPQHLHAYGASPDAFLFLHGYRFVPDQVETVIRRCRMALERAHTS